MIGVIAPASDQEAVVEFFELFKVPWESYRRGRKYNAIISTTDVPEGCHASLLLLYSGRLSSFDKDGAATAIPSGPPVELSYNGKLLPIYGQAILWNSGNDARLIEPNTRGVGDTVLHVENGTLVRVGYDLFDEVRRLLTVGQPKEMAPVPALDLHIAYLRDQLLRHGVPVIEIPPVPAGYRMIVCLSHDVDHPKIGLHRFDHTMFGFLYRAVVGSFLDLFRWRTTARKVLKNWAAVCRLPLIYLGLAKDFWLTFERYHELDGSRGSTFFIIPFKHRPGLDENGRVRRGRGAGYEPGDISGELNRLAAAGREIAVHGVDAWRDSRLGREEMMQVCGTGERAEAGVRMHWLYFDEAAPRTLEAAGFSYDSTFGYNQVVGFRAGTAQVFKPPGVKGLLELPLHIMDTALFYPAYLHLRTSEAKKVVGTLIEHVEHAGGALVINWHDRSLAPERLWDEFYMELLENLTRRGAWFPTAAMGVSWFRKRRAARFHSVDWDHDGVRVKASTSPPRRCLPGLRLRVHRPRGVQTAGRPEFVDTEFTDELEARIAW